MPLQRCGDGGKGWRFGKSGKCYTGPGGKKKAIKQGLAINPNHFASSLMVLTDENVDQETIVELLNDDETPIEMLDILMEHYKPTNLMDGVLAQEKINLRKGK